MNELHEMLKSARKNAAFWSKEVDRLQIEVALQSGDIYPRIAKVACSGLYPDRFGVVFGREGKNWPCALVSTKGAKTIRMKSGWPLVGFEGYQFDEPNWLDEDTEMEICASFKRTKWAPIIIERILASRTKFEHSRKP